MREELAQLAAEGVNVRWFAADDLPELAFDHNRIVEYALWRLRNKLEYSRIAHAFLGETFTLSELRQVHEVVLCKPLDPANFRRQVEASPGIVPTDQHVTGGRHRPPRLYRYDTSIELADNGPLAEPHLKDGEKTTVPSVDQTIQLIRTTGRNAAGEPAEACSPALAKGPWEFDSQLQYGPGSSMGDVIPVGSPRQGAIPVEYQRASNEELHDRIRAAKQALGDRVVILGHFYQRDEVVQHADFLGDSFQLANAAQTVPNAEAIVFCGVHFMAETADRVSNARRAK